MALAAGDHQVVGLLKDGTCVANSIKWNVGYGYDGQCAVGGWRDIVAIECADNFSIGLRSDGTVLLACTDEHCPAGGVRIWTDVEMIAAGHHGAAGLTKNGKIVTSGSVSAKGIDPKKGVVQLAVTNRQVYALYLDGTVGGGGENDTPKVTEKNVIAIKTALDVICVLTEDGFVHIYEPRFGVPWVHVPKNIRVFESYDRLMFERSEAEKKLLEEETMRAERRNQGVCQYCGGTLKKGLLSTKCVSCGRKKDY